MKKIIFLLLILVVALSDSTISQADLYETYEFETYTIETERFGTDIGERGYYLTKIGNSPFETTIFVENAQVMIRGMKDIDNHLVLYGDVHYLDGDTFYDSYLSIMDKEGNVVFEQVEDRGKLEIIDDVVMIDNVWIVRTIYAERGSRAPDFIHYFFTAYDGQFNVLNEITLEKEILKEKLEDELYVFSYDTLEYYEAAIDDQLNLYNYDTPLNIEEDAVYEGSVFLPVINEAMLNNQPIEHGYYVTSPGYYQLEYNGNTYSFSVDPKVTGIEDGGVYQESVMIEISHSNTYLNQDVYVSGEPITDPGNYELTVYGDNGYQKSWRFQITAKIEGVINDHTYSTPIQITFNGQGYLNNQYVESPVIVSDEGEYVLQVKGENSYLETIQFQIMPEEDTTNWIHFVQQYDIFVFIAIGISSIIYLKKK